MSYQLMYRIHEGGLYISCCIINNISIIIRMIIHFYIHINTNAYTSIGVVCWLNTNIDQTSFLHTDNTEKNNNIRLFSLLLGLHCRYRNGWIIIVSKSHIKWKWNIYASLSSDTTLTWINVTTTNKQNEPESHGFSISIQSKCIYLYYTHAKAQSV